MRLFCFDCGKSVSSEIPDGVIFRAIATCPECLRKMDEIKDKQIYIDAFNLWMDTYIGSPEKFERDFESVVKHLKEKGEGLPLSYGESATAYFLSLLKDLKERPQAPEDNRKDYGPKEFTDE